MYDPWATTTNSRQWWGRSVWRAFGHGWWRRQTDNYQRVDFLLWDGRGESFVLLLWRFVGPTDPSENILGGDYREGSICDCRSNHLREKKTYCCQVTAIYFFHLSWYVPTSASDSVVWLYSVVCPGTSIWILPFCSDSTKIIRWMPLSLCPQ